MSRAANNFDSLRLMASLAVVVSHAFLLGEGSYASEPVYAISGGQTTLGGIAVLVFFVLSGYLITQSYDRSPAIDRFVVARFLRIMPGLSVVVCLAAFVIGPLFSTAPWQSYFVSRGTYRYLLENLYVMVPVDTLPGVFSANPFPEAVNGSLWTLRFEVACYALVLLLGTLRLLRKSVVTALVVLGLVSLATVGHAHSGIEFTTDFLAGAALYFWRPRPSPPITAICAALCAISLSAGCFRFVAATAGAVVVINLAVEPAVRLPQAARYGDLSYGIYLYGFPVEQIVASWLKSRATWHSDLLLSLPVILLLAAISWHFVEKPALAWRRPATGFVRRIVVRPFEAALLPLGREDTAARVGIPPTVASDDTPS